MNKELHILKNEIKKLVSKQENNRLRYYYNDAVYNSKYLYMDNIINSKSINDSSYKDIIMNYFIKSERIMPAGSYVLSKMLLDKLDNNQIILKNVDKNLKKIFNIIDDSILEKYWNEHVIKQTFWVHTYKKIKYGVVTKALPKVSLYLLGHYTFVLLIMYNICNPSHPAHPSHEDGNMENNTSIRQSSAEIFTKQLIRFVYNNNNQTMFTNDTYFLGFFGFASFLGFSRFYRILLFLLDFLDFIGFSRFYFFFLIF